MGCKIFETLGWNYLESISVDLNLYEKKIYSQNGEDGIIEKIFDTISNEFMIVV